jgi:hypothetical protein
VCDGVHQVADASQSQYVFFGLLWCLKVNCYFSIINIFRITRFLKLCVNVGCVLNVLGKEYLTIISVCLFTFLSCLLRALSLGDIVNLYYCIILLSGDIESNPGPGATFLNLTLCHMYV